MVITLNTTGTRVISELDRRGFKATGKNEWRGNSPLRAGSDSKSFVVRIDDDGEHGAYTDHVTGESGSLYQLAAALGIETPKAQAQETKRGYDGLADYAAAHYAPESEFVAAGWHEGEHKRRPCLVYKVGGKLRYRFLDGNSPVYEWEPGGKPAWYGLERAIDRAAGRALILCNGEASTISAQHHGLSACAWAGGEQKLPDHALAELKAAYSGPVILAYDCDETGRRVAGEVAGQLESAGYPVRVADLGMTDHGDLADFCGLYAEAAYAELDKRAVASTPNLLKLTEQARTLEQQARAVTTDPQAAIAQEAGRIAAQVDRIAAAVAPARVLELHELMDELLNPQTHARRWENLPIPELDALVGPLEPELYVIYGAPNMGKSWVASSIAAALVKTGSGLIITTETKPVKFSARMASYASRIALNRITDKIAHADEVAAWRRAATALKGYETRVMDISSPSGRQVEREAKRARKEIGLDWLIVDSATRMRGMGEGVYERSSSVANALQDIARDFDIPVIVTSQIGRDVTNRPAGKRQPRLDDAYGSGVVEQNAGVVLGLYNHAYYVKRELEAEDYQSYPLNTARLYLLKHRNRPMPDQAYCTVCYEPGCGFYQYKPHTINLTEIAEGKSA